MRAGGVGGRGTWESGLSSTPQLLPPCEPELVQLLFSLPVLETP